MTTQEIANNLVSKLSKGDFNGVYTDLFDYENVRHIEPQSPIEAFRDLTGVEAIRRKDQAMGEGIAEASLPQVGEPIIKPNAIALPYKMSLKLKDGNDLTIDEIIVYEVQEGKIISEQFFY